MVNDSLREACAEILEALTKPHNGDPRRVGQLLRGARTLRWAERHEYGDPVPADEVQARIDAALAEAEREWWGDEDEAARLTDIIGELRDLVAPTKLAAYDKRRGVWA